MTRWCLLAAVAVSLLSPSVPVQPAKAQDHVRTKDGTFSQKLRGTDVRPEVATPVGKARDLSPEMADEERARGGKTTQGRNRRSVTQSRSTSSLFSQHLGTGSKLLLTVSLLAGAALMLRRLGGALWKCLAEVGSLQPRDGSTPRSLSSLPSGDACERLLGQIAENYGDNDVRLESQSAGLALHPSGFTPNLMLVTIVLFAIIAISLAGPPTTTRTDAEDLSVLLEGTGEDEEYASGEEEEVDDTPAPVEMHDGHVTVGKGWLTREGVSKEGRSVEFSYDGKRYTLYLTTKTEVALKNRLLNKVVKVLQKGPREVKGKFIWGRPGRNSILALDWQPEDGGLDVGVDVYLPGGVFGLTKENPLRLETDENVEGYIDLWNLMYATMHVIVKGQPPPPEDAED